MKILARIIATLTVSIVLAFTMFNFVYAASFQSWKRTGTGNEITPVTINGTTADVVLDDLVVNGTFTGTAAGATKALDNLASVAINTSLVSDTTSTDSLGSAAITWLNIFVDNIGATATRVTKGWFTDIESTNEPTVGGIAYSAFTKTFTNTTFDANGTGNSLSNVDLTADVTGILPSTGGGTGNGFTAFTGPTTSEKTFTLPDASSTLLYSGGALGTPSSGTLTNATGYPGDSSLTTTGTLTSGATGAGYTVALGTSTVTGILGSANGGTGNGFTAFTGATTAEKTYTLPDASTTILTTNAAVTPAQGGTGLTTYTLGDIIYSSASNVLSALTGNTTATKKFLTQTGDGANSAAPAWNTILAADYPDMVGDSGAGGTKGAVPAPAAGDAAAGKFLKADGTWAAPSASSSTPTKKMATIFETAARFSSSTASGGSVTYTANGVTLDTSATGGGRVALNMNMDTTGNDDPFAGSPIFTATIQGNTSATDFDSFIGIGVPTLAAGGITYTDKHIGFKITRTASGTVELKATQADGTTENASASLHTVSSTELLDLIVVVNGTTSVDYYFRVNGGALSAATNLTSNLPTAGAGDAISMRIGNKNVATDALLYGISMSYER